MLKATFPNVKCPNGHILTYVETECPKCHKSPELSKVTTSLTCECGMIRPEIIETKETGMEVFPSKFCFWCGKYFDSTPEQVFFSY